MKIETGVDVVNIPRIEKIYTKCSTKFLQRIFTEKEIELIKAKNYNSSYIAKRFAAKEALAKALGTGIGKISFLDIEIFKNKNSAPFFVLSSNLQKYLKNDRKWHDFSLSLSLSDDYPTAIAFVVILINKIN